MSRPWPALGRNATGKKKIYLARNGSINYGVALCEVCSCKIMRLNVKTSLTCVLITTMALRSNHFMHKTLTSKGLMAFILGLSGLFT